MAFGIFVFSIRSVPPAGAYWEGLNELRLRGLWGIRRAVAFEFRTQAKGEWLGWMAFNPSHQATPREEAIRIHLTWLEEGSAAQIELEVPEVGSLDLGTIEPIVSLWGATLQAGFDGSTLGLGQFEHFVLYLNPELRSNPFASATDDRVPILEGQDFEVRRWRTQEGLPTNDIRSIAIDAQGLLWFGSIHGLIQFDGAEFVHYTAESTGGALPDNNIPSLTVDREGRLVILTKGSGVFYYDNGAFEPAADNPILEDQWLRSAYIQPSDNSLWLTAEHQRLFHLDARGRVLDSYDIEDVLPFPLPAEPLREFGWVYGVGADEVCVSLYGSLVGNLRLDLQSGRHQMLQAPWGHRGYLASRDRSGIWRLGKNMVDFFDFESTTVLRWGSTASADLPWFFGRPLETRDGELWTGVMLEDGTQRGAGLWRIGSDGWRRYPLATRYREGNIEGLAEDHEGNVWFFLTSGGIGRLRRHEISTLDQVSEAAEGERVRYVTTDGERVWFSGGAIVETDLEDVLNVTRTPPLRQGGEIVADRDYTIMAVTVDDQTPPNVWAAMGRSSQGRVSGLVYPALMRVRAGEVLETFDLPIEFPELQVAHAAAWCQRFGVLIGGDAGLYRFQEGRWWFYDEFGSILSLLPSRDGETVWIGSGSHGLFRFGGRATHHWTEKDGLTTQEILSLYEDARGVLWAGGYAGLNRIEKGKALQIQSDSGFLQQYINLILEDDIGNLWFTTVNGIYVAQRGILDEVALEERGADEVPIFRFGLNDGMPGLGTSSTYFPSGANLEDGRFVICMERHPPLLFHPERLLRSVTGSPMRISGVSRPEQVYEEAMYGNGWKPPTSTAERVLPSSEPV